MYDSVSPEAQNPDVWRAYYRRKFLELASVLLTRERVSSFFSPLTISTSPPPPPPPKPRPSHPSCQPNTLLHHLEPYSNPFHYLRRPTQYPENNPLNSSLLLTPLPLTPHILHKKKSLPRSQRPFPNSSGVSSGTSFCVLQGYTASEREAWRTFVLSLPWIFNSDLRVSSPSRVLAELTIS